MSETPSFKQRCRGCLLGGAVGDALGAPVEFMTSAQIHTQFGPGGIRDLAPAYGRVGAITDDTQMTLFTAEGMLRAVVRYANRGICHVPSVVHRAYVRWLRTQGYDAPELDSEAMEDGWLNDGWLIGVRELWSRRAPGNTCISALRDARQIGAPAVNDSKGCGGVMRIAPVGLIANRQRVFELGSETAALTHGHPSGFLSAGFLAQLIEQIVAGSTLTTAIQTAKNTVMVKPGCQEVLTAVEKATALAKLPGRANVAVLGKGWVAEEALAISLYCALVGTNLIGSNFEEAVVLAVNHSGDSDSTGAITGNICGAIFGEAAIPARWLKDLELREEIAMIADDLAAFHEGELDLESESVFERYPGW